MQLVSVISAAALLSNTAFAAVPHLEKKSPHWWNWHHQQHDVVEAAATTDAAATTTDDAEYADPTDTASMDYSVETIIDTGDPEATTTWEYYTDEATATVTETWAEETPMDTDIPGTIIGGHGHHHHQHSGRPGHTHTAAYNSSAAASSSTCPTDVTSFITLTVTANATSTRYIPSILSSKYTSFLSAAPSTSSAASSNTTLQPVVMTLSKVASSSFILPAAPSSTITTMTPRHRHHHHHGHGHGHGHGHEHEHKHEEMSEMPTFSTSIFVSALPVSVGSTDLHPYTTVSATTTITSGQATGTPNPYANHCGVHGYPVGNYFLAEFVEELPGHAVSLLGCFEFCTSVYGIRKGCASYQFYSEEGTGAPRCALYGGSVAASLDSINKYVPNVWYDLECGNPSLF